MLEPVARHKTAISRIELSRPIKLALTDKILAADQALFDYGCGLGDDLRLLGGLGFQATGWDPVHRPEQERCRAPVVNIGYVVNVIENPAERQDALRRAWALAEQVLIVSARLTLEAKSLRESSAYEDGLLTGRGTFQKFFEQQELRHWIDQTLRVSAVPAAPGIFYVFRDDEARTQFMAARFRRSLAAPRLSKSAELFTRHQERLAPLMDFIGERGRLPFDDELLNAADLTAVFGSIRKAFRVVLYATDSADWDIVKEERRRDLLIYLALSRFEGRPPFGKLPRTLQRDVKALFGTYKTACAHADDILFSLGQPEVVETACRESKLGKLTPAALYIHECALPALSLELRLYEGCARGYLGRVEGANIIKLHREEPKISYLAYPDFESDPHPPLASSLTVHLQTFRVKTRSYKPDQNRPILHRKELFIPEDHPLHSKFSRLTRIEESKGLFEDTSRIGLQDGWNEALTQRGLTFRGHRLISTTSAF